MRRFVVGLLVLTLAGCGGGGSLSRTEYAKRGNAICREMNRTLGRLKPPGFDPSAKGARAARQQEDLRRFARESNAIVGPASARLGKLKPPPELRRTRDDWLRVLAKLETMAERLTSLAIDWNNAVQDGDAQAAMRAETRYQRATRAGVALVNRGQSLVTKLGWRVCVSGQA